MKTRPFVISAGIGLLIQGIYLILSFGVTFFTLQNFFGDFNPDVVPDLSGSGFLPVTLIFSGIGLCCGPILNIGLGVLYALLHNRETPVTPETGAIGGATSVATFRFLGGILGIMLGFFVSIFLNQQMFSAGEIPPEAFGTFQLFSTFTSIISGFIGAIFSALFGGLMGALGGGLTGAVLRR